MGKSVSADLRLRIVRGIAAGGSRRSMAARFEVAPSTAVRVASALCGDGFGGAGPARSPEGIGQAGAASVRHHR